MLPDPEALADFHPTERLTANARPAPPWRDELRRIPNAAQRVRGALPLRADDRHHRRRGLDRQPASCGRWRSCSWAARTRSSPRSCTKPRTGCCSATGASTTGSGAGCSASRRSRRSTSTAAATWRTTATSSAPTSPTSRSTAATRSSGRRCAASSRATPTGRTGFKLFKGLLRGVAIAGARGALAGAAHRRRCSSLLIAIGIALGHPWVYFILWLAPYLTVWRVINRLRSIAEHGGMERSKDRRLTTHSVRQSFLARFFARAVPHRLAPRAPRRLRRADGQPARSCTPSSRRSGYVTDAIEYPSYRALWAKLSRPADRHYRCARDGHSPTGARRLARRAARVA